MFGINLNQSKKKIDCSKGNKRGPEQGLGQREGEEEESKGEEEGEGEGVGEGEDSSFVFIRLLSAVQQYLINKNSPNDQNNWISSSSSSSAASSSSSSSSSSSTSYLPYIPPHMVQILAPSLHLILKCHFSCYSELSGLGLLLSAPLVRQERNKMDSSRY